MLLISYEMWPDPGPPPSVLSTPEKSRCNHVPEALGPPPPVPPTATDTAPVGVRHGARGCLTASRRLLQKRMQYSRTGMPCNASQTLPAAPVHSLGLSLAYGLRVVSDI